VRLGVDGLFTNFPDLLAGLTMPNTGGPPLSLLATAGALAVYDPLAIFGFSCAGAPRRARSRARVVLITKHTDGDEPGLCIRGGWDLLYALL
jgi:hypothetical protein